MDSNILIHDSGRILETSSSFVLNENTPSFYIPKNSVSVKQINKMGELISDEIPLRKNNGFSGYTESNQFVIDSTLNSNFDIISTNILFKKLKDYEKMYNEISENYYLKWIKGEVLTTPEVYNWMSIYRILFNISNK